MVCLFLWSLLALCVQGQFWTSPGLTLGVANQQVLWYIHLSSAIITHIHKEVIYQVMLLFLVKSWVYLKRWHKRAIINSFYILFVSPSVSLFMVTLKWKWISLQDLTFETNHFSILHFDGNNKEYRDNSIKFFKNTLFGFLKIFKCRLMMMV